MPNDDLELDGLSDEEREALADGDDDDASEIESLKNIAGIEDEDDTDDSDIEAHVASRLDPAVDVAEVSETANVPEPFMPTYQAEPVENFDGKMQELLDAKKDLRAKLNEGEIDLDSYEEQKDALITQEFVLREMNTKASISSEQKAQTAHLRWEWEQEQFFESESNKMYLENRMLMAAMNTAVKDLADDPAHDNKNAAWFLKEADRQVRASFGVNGTATSAAPNQPVVSRKPDLSIVPKTLGGLPAAELSETGSDEFANLDNLDGMALESALSKMNPEQQSRYLGVSA